MNFGLKQSIMGRSSYTFKYSTVFVFIYSEVTDDSCATEQEFIGLFRDCCGGGRKRPFKLENNTVFSGS